MAISDQRLRAIIELMVKGDDKTKRALKDVADQTKDVEKQTSMTSTAGDKMRSVLGGIALAAGTAGAAMYAAKKAFDFGKEGAQIEKVRDTFDSLTTSIGETSGAIISDLRNATAGMVADTELMASANRFLSMGLANTGDEASKLANIAVTLGAAMGKDATGAMEEFALLLSNQSIPRLDTFGISAGRVRERIIELQAANEGMSRETAFMTAVMDEAQISMTKLGGDVPVDEFTKFEVQLKNVNDEIKVLAAQNLGPVIGALVTILNTNSLKNRFEGLGYSATEWAGLLMDADNELGVFNDHTAVLTKTIGYLEAGLKGSNKELIQWASAAVAADQRAAGMNKYYRSVYPVAGAIHDVTERTEAWERVQAALAAQLQHTIDEVNDLDLQKQIREMNAIEKAAIKAANAYAEYDAQLMTMGDLSKYVEAGQAAMGRAFRIGSANLGLLNEDLDDLGSFMVTVGGRTADQNDILSDATSEYERLGREIARTAAAPELYGLNAEEAADKIKEMTDRQNELLPLMDRMGSITGTAALATKEATVNYDALNTSLFEYIQQTDKLADGSRTSTEMIIAMGLATGDLNEQQAAAILKAYDLRLAIEEIGNAYTSGLIPNAEDATSALMAYAAGEYETVEQAIAATTHVIELSDALGSIVGYYDAELRLHVSGLESLEHAWQLFNAMGGDVSGFGNQTGQSSDQQAQEQSGQWSPPGYQYGGNSDKDVFDDADFHVPAGGSPAVAAFAPGDYVVAQKTPIRQGGGNVVLNIYPQTEMDVTRAVNKALAEVGMRSDSMARRS